MRGQAQRQLVQVDLAEQHRAGLAQLRTWKASCLGTAPLSASDAPVVGMSIVS